MEVLILLFLILLNGIFALSEIALVSLRKSRIEQMASTGDKRALLVLGMLKQPEMFLSSIQIGITLIGIVSGVYGGLALVDDIRPTMETVEMIRPFAYELSLLLIIGSITYVSILFGELIPKTLAINHPERIALIFGPLIKLFSIMTYPAVRLLEGSTRFCLKVMRVKYNDAERLSEEELRYLIKRAGTQGVLEREETQLHQNIFLFTELRAKDILTHRTEVTSIDLQASHDVIVDILQKSQFSKFPVWEETIDNVKGYITAKEYLLLGKQEGKNLSQLLHEVLFFPETIPAIEILRRFRSHKKYFGVIVDEFGSFQGIVTLHNLIETIIGHLPGTEESNEPDIYHRDDGSLLVAGFTSVHTFNQNLGEECIPIQEDQYTTVAGFMISVLKKIPSSYEQFDFNNYRFEIVDLDGTRIDKIVIRKLSTPEPPGTQEGEHVVEN